MFRSTLLAVLLSLACANIHDRAYYEEKFFNWLKEHNVVAESGEHFVHMLQNFADNDDIIVSTNAKNLSYTLGHNKFSHMNEDEWRKYIKLGLARRPDTESSMRGVHEAGDVSALPTSVDWVTSGSVTGVKDQGSCGSCWSFSTTGSLEGAYKNKYGSLVSFSEQNLVDCDTRKNGGSDLGCNGGLMDSAFQWVEKNGGLCTEADYPYVAKQNDCKTTCTKNTRVKPSSYKDVKANSDSDLMSALTIGPVSVAIEADQAAFQLYKSGVFTASCGTDLDHGVLVVGYGTDSGKDFYKVKNSWGTSWGEAGYIRLARGISQKAGQCGILSEPSYPVL